MDVNKWKRFKRSGSYRRTVSKKYNYLSKKVKYKSGLTLSFNNIVESGEGRHGSAQNLEYCDCNTINLSL